MDRALIVASLIVAQACLSGCGRIGYTPLPVVDDGGHPLLDTVDTRADGFGPTADGGLPPDGRADTGIPTPSDGPPSDAHPGSIDVAPDGERDLPATDVGCFGCLPRDVTLEGMTETIRRGTPGSPTMDLCPADEVLIGFEGTQSRNPSYPWLQGLVGLCGDLAIDSLTLAVSVTPTGRLPLRGGDGGTAWTRACPTNNVLVGFEGRDGMYVNQLDLHCAPLLVTRQGDQYVTSIGGISVLPVVGAQAGSEFPATSCPAGQIGRGAVITATNFIDSFSLLCGRPAVQLR